MGISYTMMAEKLIDKNVIPKTKRAKNSRGRVTVGHSEVEWIDTENREVGVSYFTRNDNLVKSDVYSFKELRAMYNKHKKR